MVKKIGEVGQEKGWYGGRQSPRINDLRLTERQLEQIRHRKGMERITKKGSNVLKMPRGTYDRLFAPEPLAGIRDPLSLGAKRTEISSWTPDVDAEGGWAGSYEYNPSTFEQLRRGREDQPGRFVPVAEIEGLNPEFGLRPQRTLSFGEGAFSPVEGSEGIMPAWTTGSDLPRRFRSRMPATREAFRLQQMQAVAANPFGNPYRANWDPVPGGIPGGPSGFAETPATDISQKMQSNLGKQKGAPKPYLPGRTRMPFEIP